MRNSIILLLLVYALCSCSANKVETKDDFIVANGQMPSMVKDENNNIHLVYGRGDSIFYSFSTDKASSFSTPALISALPHVYTSATRGPQIAATKGGVVVTACTSSGDIYSFHNEVGGDWTQGKRVNDVDTIAKEGLMALSADGDNAFAVWLDVRKDEHNKIYGAKSSDGGKTWSKNIMVYTSPDSSVCECCKPSVVVKGKNVYVMFRNWLGGNRDLYLAQSNDGGTTFNDLQKLGNGSWKLNGCPMDGGGLTVTKQGEVQTVWRREGTIFAATPGRAEQQIGEGKGCTIETVNNKNVYAWSEKGEIVVVNSEGKKKVVGEGNLPVLKVLNDEHILCMWESNKRIHASIIEL